MSDITPPAGDATTSLAAASGPVIQLSELLGRPVIAKSGETVGRVEDVIVNLRAADQYPLVTGIVVGSAADGCLFIGTRFTEWARIESGWPRTRSTCGGLSAATVRCCCAPMCSVTG